MLFYFYLVVYSDKMSTHIFYLLLFFDVLLPWGSNSQRPETNTYRFAFYNVENYFDYFVDSTNQYNEFTPAGSMRWTRSKYEKKRAKLQKVLAAMGEWDGLTLIGFAEIENAFVLHDIIRSSKQSMAHYRSVHFDSKDPRGIDVGIIYDADRFKVLSSQSIPVLDDKHHEVPTRNILYVKGTLQDDTLHVFVNHWTSRYRGLMESTPLRRLCARSLLACIDSICHQEPLSAIIVMGDFNDNPGDESTQLLVDSSACLMENIAAIPTHNDVFGSMKFQGEWFVFDQVLVSRNLVGGAHLFVDSSAVIFSPSFLLMEDKKYLGVKPRRNHTGYKYQDGFSDHLPIFIDIYQEK